MDEHYLIGKQFSNVIPQERIDHRQSGLGERRQRNLQLQLYPQRSHGKGQQIL